MHMTQLHECMPENGDEAASSDTLLFLVSSHLIMEDKIMATKAMTVRVSGRMMGQWEAAA